MTAVAGFVHDGRVWIGSDSAGVGGTDLTIRLDRKVFKNGEMLFGFTSSYRMGQLLRYALSVPAQREDEDVFQFLVTSFADAVRKCLKDGGFATKTNEAEEAGEFLLGYRGRLFYIGGNYQVGEAADRYDAVGCGMFVCKGALHATIGMEPEERMRLVLSAAEHNNSAVRSPFVIESI